MPTHPYGKRKIIHVDMDAFYASIEALDRPELRSVPVVVGGSPQSRGVVCTANYIARRYGIHSAMACSVAFRLCPEAVFVTPRFERYREISQTIRGIFLRYTDIIEPLSLDEAYLDVTESSLGLYASQIAKKIQEQVFAETGLTCSAGVGPNKLVAKIASDFRKPSGLTVVPPEQVPSFMINLPIRKIHGIGPVAEARLKTIGITHCRDVLNFSGPLLDSNPLISAMGRSGPWLVAAAQGIDHRAVETTWERKSYGREETFAKDVTDLPVLEAELSTLSSRIARDLVRANLKAKTVTLKIKYHNFESITRSRTMMEPLNNPEGIFETLRLLLLTKTEAGVRPVRLIGLSTSRFICA